MFENLSIFRTAQAMAVHAGARQALSAQNMANADTPGFVARDLTPFADLAKGTISDVGMRSTRATHLRDGGGQYHSNIVERDGEHDPNGNSVSLEMEMLSAVEAKRQHDRALAIYRSSLSVLRAVVAK